METETAHRLTTAEIGLLREISRWRRNHGVTYFQWRPGVGFGVLTEWKCWSGPDRDRRMANLTYEPERDSRAARLLVSADYYRDDFREIPAATVTQAVDMLVALGYLPQRFSSAYQAGWHASSYWYGTLRNEDDETEFRRLFHDPENISFPVDEGRSR